MENTFTFEDRVTEEEKSVMYGVSNNFQFDIKKTNEVLNISRKHKYSV